MTTYIKNIDPIQTRKPASDQVVFINDKIGFGSISIAGQVFKILDVGYVCGYPTFTCIILDRFACLFFPPSYCNVCAVCWHIEGIVPVPDWTNCGIQSGAYGLLVFFKSAWMCHCLRLLNYVSINVNVIQFVGTTPGFCGLPIMIPPFHRFNPFPFIPLGGGEPPLLTEPSEIPSLSLDLSLSAERKNFLNGVENSLNQQKNNQFINIGSNLNLAEEAQQLATGEETLFKEDTGENEFLDFIKNNNDISFDDNDDDIPNLNNFDNIENDKNNFISFDDNDDDIPNLNNFDNIENDKNNFISSVNMLNTLDSSALVPLDSVDSNGFIVDLTSDGCGEPFRPGLTHSEDYNPSDLNTIKDLCSESSSQQNGLSSLSSQKDKKCVILNPKTEHIYSRMPKNTSDSCSNDTDSQPEKNNGPVRNILGKSGCNQNNDSLNKNEDEGSIGIKKC